MKTTKFDVRMPALAAALMLAFALPAQAQSTPSSQPAPRGDAATTRTQAANSADRKARKAEEDRIEAEYKSAKKQCNGLKGNAQDVCEKEAKGREKVAKAELKAKEDPSPKNQRKAAEAKADADYDVAKEKCDDLKGADKSACVKDAKAKHEQARADIKKQYASNERGASGRTASAGATGNGARK